MKKYFTLSNISTWIFVAFIIAMLVFPGFKATVIRGFMQIGLFQPKVQQVDPDTSYDRVRSTTFADAQGNRVVLNELENKVLFVNFWATWCPPCIAEMPSIQKLYDRFKDDDTFVFMMIDVDNQPEKNRKFMQEKGLSLPVYYPAGNIESALYTGSLPTTAVIDKKGNIVFRDTGANDFGNKKFVAFMESLR